jgi:hypothetical protein
MDRPAERRLGRGLEFALTPSPASLCPPGLNGEACGGVCMRNSILFVLGVAFLATAASAARPRADRDDTVHMTCVVEFGSGGEPTQVTPIVKLTVPWMPAGSSEASTRTFVEADFRALMLLRQVKFTATFCITGVSLADVRERIASWDKRDGNGRKKVVLDPNDVFPPLFDRMYNGQKIGRPEITRARYNAVVAAPHGK